MSGVQPDNSKSSANSIAPYVAKGSAEINESCMARKTIRRDIERDSLESLFMADSLGD
jgi:hypothetical protein